ANGAALAFAAGDSGSMTVGGGAPFTLTASAGFISYIDIYSTGSGGGDKILLDSVSTIATTVNTTLTFDATLADADHDTTTGTISVTINSAAPPVVLDLNGDGVKFLPTSAGVTYDYGSGKVATAWASPQDGILAYDDGGKLNISFTQYAPGATSDLAALAAFDTNHDGQLSAADADFGKFGVWQDANGNGVVDPGEFKSLSAAGIVSLSLSSDGKSYVAAGGDVTVNGTTTFTRADGTTGQAADAAFATATAPAASVAKPADELRAANESYVNQGLAAGLAAAVLVATADAADHAAHVAGGARLGTEQLGAATFAPSHADASPVTPSAFVHAAAIIGPSPSSPAIGGAAPSHHALIETTSAPGAGGLSAGGGGFAGHALTSFSEPATPVAAGGGGISPLAAQGVDLRGLSALEAGVGAGPSNASGGAAQAAVAKILTEALQGADGNGHDLSSLVARLGGGEAGAPGVSVLQAHVAAGGTGAEASVGGGVPGLSWSMPIDFGHHLSTMNHHTDIAQSHV
ncbi:MAG TPA: hypothetical protein VG939_03655, partial [Caulobacteraceae bacterium]|nr:hypothetical protein [Caulobacteraceae bacterium]